MMLDAIRNFPKQFEFEPKIENSDKFTPRSNFIIAGMGGSNLATGFLKMWKPEIDLTIHRDYGLPAMDRTELEKNFVIASSYSGNTEEALSSFEAAIKENLKVGAISAQGELLKMARTQGKPLIVIPDTGIEPRSAGGFSTVALLKFTGNDQALAELKETAKDFNPSEAEPIGKEIAEKIRGFVPVVYSSTQNEPLARNWKIRLNESGKVPCFYNVFPELNHNEMNSFNLTEANKELSQKFYFIFLEDQNDHPRIQKRMKILKDLFSRQGFPIYEHNLLGKNVWEKIFFSIMVADWTAYYTATGYGMEPEEVKMVEKFKDLMKQ